MHRSRFVVNVLALIGLALALTFGSMVAAPLAGAQEGGVCDPSLEGVEGYEGYDGYDGCDTDDTGDGTDNEETATPPLGSTGGGTLPNTGGVQMLAVAGAGAAIALTLRRLRTS